MITGAKNPDRISEKVNECRFFLVLMADYERVLEDEKFRYCLSAFLSAFRSATYRLMGVTHKRFGKPAKDSLKKRLDNHKEIGFLIRQRDKEVHSDGAVVFQRIAVHLFDSMQVLSGVKGFFIPRAAGWEFEGNSKNLIELCHDALVELEHSISQTFTSQSAPC